MPVTLDDINKLCEKNAVKMADFMMIDMNGRWRHLTMPIARLTEDTLKNGVGFDGSNYGFAPVEKSDMIFIPDLASARMDPFAEIPTLSMIGDVYVIDLPENWRFDQYPRNVAIHAEEYLRSTGIADEIRIGPEFEFNVFDHVSYAVHGHYSGFKIDSSQAEWNTGSSGENLGYKVPHKGGYHATPPWDRLGGFRSKATILMEEAGIAVKYHHHEVGGPGQVEIEVEFGGLREMADKTMLTKYILKNAAIAEGKTVTFMPKPIYGEAGNGMHVHMHLFKNGKPLFYDANGYSQLSETALFFIGGLLKHVRALCGFTNPSTNSYKRLVPGYEAPVTIGFATSNRSSVIRIPAYAKDPDKKRFELRSPDGTCNPYYAYSAILMAGIDGIKNKIDPREKYGPYDFNLYNLSKKEQAKIKFLPQSLDEALDALAEDHGFLTEGGVFPNRLIEIWIENKRKESSRYKQLPHPVEFETCFDL
ncbi:MAG: type I glutamate--ammonia ligase [Treponema sp.]|jgi:glutamine synthetase|nr:type I glutamate--ammonia ligase [Treponema sp.]